MDTVYIALVRYGPEWDGQSIYKTKSKALFDQMVKINHTYSNKLIRFPEFSDELKADLRVRHAEDLAKYPDLELLDEDMNIQDAMEWLDGYDVKFPVIVAGETELTCSWNW